MDARRRGRAPCASVEPRYPEPPWHTHGRAIFQAFAVRAEALRLPAGLSPVTRLGRAIGVLGLVEYVTPSPLSYRELVWMPCFVSAPVEGGRRARGYFVETMLVDSEASLRGGRELWALPKRMARFEWSEREAIVEDGEGARVVLAIDERGPAIRGRSSIATIQDGGGGALVRFRGSGTARVRSARLRIREARGIEGWAGLASATRLPALGFALSDFAITMHPPVRARLE